MSLALAKHLDSDSLARAKEASAESPEVTDAQVLAALSVVGLKQTDLDKIKSRGEIGKYMIAKAIELSAGRNFEHERHVDEVMRVVVDVAKDTSNEANVRVAAADSVAKLAMTATMQGQYSMKLLEVNGRGSSRKHQKSLAPRVLIQNITNTNGAEKPRDAEVVIDG